MHTMQNFSLAGLREEQGYRSFNLVANCFFGKDRFDATKILGWVTPPGAILTGDTTSCEIKLLAGTMMEQFDFPQKLAFPGSSRDLRYTVALLYKNGGSPLPNEEIVIKLISPSGTVVGYKGFSINNSGYVLDTQSFLLPYEGYFRVQILAPPSVPIFVRGISISPGEVGPDYIFPRFITDNEHNTTLANIALLDQNKHNRKGEETHDGKWTNKNGEFINESDTTLGDSSEDSLTVKATSTFKENVTLDKVLNVKGSTTLGDVKEDLLTVKATSTFKENVTAEKHTKTKTLEVTDNITENLTLLKDLTVKGSTTLGDVKEDLLTVKATATFDESVNVKGSTTLGDVKEDLLTVKATSTFKENVTLDKDLNVKGSTILGEIEEDLLTVKATSTFKEKVTLDKNLDVKGSTTLGDANADLLTVKANTTFEDVVHIKKNSTFGESDKPSTISTFYSQAVFNNYVNMTKNITLGSVTNNVRTTITQQGTATIYGPSTFFENVVFGKLSPTSTNVVHFYPEVTFFGKAILKGSVDIGDAKEDTLTVKATATFDESLTVKGNTTLGDTKDDTLTVNATSTFKENVTLDKDLTVKGSTTLGDVKEDTLTVNAASTFKNALKCDAAPTENTDVLRKMDIATMGGGQGTGCYITFNKPAQLGNNAIDLSDRSNQNNFLDQYFIAGTGDQAGKICCRKTCALLIVGKVSATCIASAHTLAETAIRITRNSDELTSNKARTWITEGSASDNGSSSVSVITGIYTIRIGDVLSATYTLNVGGLDQARLELSMAVLPEPILPTNADPTLIVAGNNLSNYYVSAPSTFSGNWTDPNGIPVIFYGQGGTLNLRYVSGPTGSSVSIVNGRLYGTWNSSAANNYTTSIKCVLSSGASSKEFQIRLQEYAPECDGDVTHRICNGYSTPSDCTGCDNTGIPGTV